MIWQDFLTEVILQTVLITFFVLSMIMVLEYINVFSMGHVNDFMQKHTSFQIIVAAVLGLLPGCVGSFTAVSLYTHNVIGFGALMSNLIATTGDEAFFMVSLMPEKAFIIFLILLVLSVTVGYIINFIAKKYTVPCGNQIHFMLHKHVEAELGVRGNLKDNFRHVSYKRLIIIGAILIFIVMTFLGFFEEEEHHDESALSALSITFLVLSLVSLFVIVTVPNHFLEDHIWHHVIGKHFKKISIWTFVALLAIFVLTNIVDINSFVTESNQNHLKIIFLLTAILIGLIPQSGPHLIFITLYCTNPGMFPFGALLANCIVQDGHGAIPLFAESKKEFFIVKGIKVLIAFVLGSILIYQ